ncbi:MAG: DNA-directed RNA polymerase subunit alpha [Deinococcus sp.]|nr:DNA-directed RNA polymerase subunit alpha [Deinococcus sp.]
MKELQTRITSQVEGNYGEFVIEPLHRGFGQTLGNPLRRVLLSSIPGTAVTSVTIEDVLHEFSTIDGVVEDVVKIIFALKEVVVRFHTPEPKVLKLSASKPGEVTAADFDVPSTAEVINPELHIATLEPGGKLKMEVRVEQGYGYVPAAELPNRDLRINAIPVDAIFTPVRRVNYLVEDTRVGRDTDFDKLTLQIWTNGAVSPQDALNQAVVVLQGQLAIFSGSTAMQGAKKSEEELLPIEELGLATRVHKTLVENGIRTIDQLVGKGRSGLRGLSGVGPAALEEIEERLATFGLQLKD